MHRAFTVAIGIGLAAAFISLSTSSASAADPYGYWRKVDQGEYPAKMQIHRCGSGGRYLCVKIAWLQKPLDSKGNPLRDVRNSNPSQRGREIMGLPIVRGMAKVGANQWKGNIYNPEDGNTYSATLTMVSQSKIILKGCKAFLLCGQRVWVRTSPPPKPEPEVKPEEQIEASAEPNTTPEAATNIATRAEPEANALGETQMVTPASQQSAQPGYRFLNGSATAQGQAGFTGDNVPSMFVMTKPIEDAADTASAAAGGASVPAEPKPAAQPAPVPQPKPVAEPTPAPQSKPQTRTIQANAAPAPQPRSQAAPKPAPAPAAAETENVGEPNANATVAEATTESDTADADAASTTEATPPRKLTWRERRRLRRQQRLMQSESEGLLPWLR
jgi:uncharacterized protein (DUF2147 family)